MKEILSNLELRDVRWTSIESFQLPAWYKAKDWISGYRNLWLGIEKQKTIINLEFEVASWSEYENILEKISLSNANRFLLYIPVRAKGKSQSLWSEVLDSFNESTPSWNCFFKPISLQSNAEPHLALCVEKRAKAGEIQSTFLIPHWESVGFLELFLYSFNEYFTQRDRPTVLVIDDGSSQATFNEVSKICTLYGAKIEQIQRIDKNKVADVGAVLDYGIKFINTKYVCMLDADIVLLDKNFENVCKKILEDKSIISIGLDTSLADDYHSNFQWGKNRIIKTPGKQLPNYYSVTNNLFRFMRTEDARVISENCGFSRAISQRKMRDQVGRLIRKISRKILSDGQNRFINELIKRPIFNSRFPIMPPTCDNGVAANAWIDDNMMGIKWNIPITSYGFLTNKDGAAFQNISGMMVHIALSTRALSESRREVDDAGEKYYQAIQSIIARDTPLSTRLEDVINLSLSIENSA